MPMRIMQAEQSGSRPLKRFLPPISNAVPGQRDERGADRAAYPRDLPKMAE